MREITIVELTWGPKGFERDQVYDLVRGNGESDRDLIERAILRFVEQRCISPSAARICNGEKSYRVRFSAERPVPTMPAAKGADGADAAGEVIRDFFRRYGGGRR